jgi:hypothetical protein
MNQPTDPTQKSCRRPRLVKIWLALFTLVVLAMVIVKFTTNAPKHPPYILMTLLFAVLGASLPIGLWLFVRWLMCWRNARRTLLGLAALATLWAIFVAEENWRCQREWENYKRAKQAAGDWHEWDEFIPPPVPDGDNVFQAPHIADSFTRNRKNAYVEGLNARYTNALAKVTKSHANSFPIAELIVLRSGETAPAGVDAGLVFADSSLRDRVGQLLESTLGPRCVAPRDLALLLRDPQNLKPVRIVLRADHALDLKELEKIFPRKNWPASGDCVDVKQATNNQSFTLEMRFGQYGWCLASDYLQASAEREPFYTLVDEALQRPQVRMESDYKDPIAIPIPNFVQLRNIAQELGARAQCHLLLGEPGAAVRELARMHRLQRFTVEQRPMTLVSAMINVAIFGLYADTIAEGFRLNAWRDENLAALGKQLGDIDVIPPVMLAFRMERVAINRTIDRAAGSPKKLSNVYYGALATVGGKETRRSFTEKLQRLLVYCLPNGWLYQNQLYYNQTMDAGLLVAWDGDRGQIHPRLAEQSAKRLEEMATGEKQSRLLALYNKYARNMIAACAVPNFTRATQATVRNQTKISEALVACALERHRAAQGEYPETLAALTPQFIGQIPHDLIGGEPLKYRRTTDPSSPGYDAAGGKFLLYSIGWNEKDDGGVVARNKDGSENRTDGDWVWGASK